MSFLGGRARAMMRGLAAKRLRLSGRPCPVSPTCQIPELREKYTALRLPRKGTFVEIGANDGESCSNTSFLADEGWRGIYVEPIPKLCNRIRRRHWLNRVSVEQVAISDTEGTATIHSMGPLTTLDDETRAAYEEISWSSESAAKARPLQVRTTTIERVLAKNAVPRDFDLMVLDVEGHEEPVVAGLLASPWRPRVLIVELVDRHPDFTRFPRLQASAKRTREVILADGYREFYSDIINTIFALALERVSVED